MSNLDFDGFLKTEFANCHVHIRSIPLIEDIRKLFTELGQDKVGIVCPGSVSSVNDNPPAMCYKAAHPQETYILGGIDYSRLDANPKKLSADFANQARAFRTLGFDGVKLLEGKPTVARDMPFFIDDPIYHDFFSIVEEEQFPIIWHVADPEEFWDDATAPAIAVERGWTYSSDVFPKKEALYRQAENVLKRFGGLKVIFAHFYFLSADLPRAAELMDRYPNVSFDITPGAEMFHNFSKTPEATRDFFIKYQDRILFGDDTLVTAPAIETQGIKEKRHFMRSFLETDKSLLVPEGDCTFLSENWTVQGIDLPEAALKKIYAHNFYNLAGPQPCALNVSACIEECHRIAGVLEKKYNVPDENNFAREAEQFLSGTNGKL